MENCVLYIHSFYIIYEMNECITNNDIIICKNMGTVWEERGQRSEVK